MATSTCACACVCANLPLKVSAKIVLHAFAVQAQDVVVGIQTAPGVILREARWD